MDKDELYDALVTLNERNQHLLKTSFDRSLPFSEGIFDRWERAKTLEFGENTSIYDSACVFGEVNVGANTWVGPNVILDGSGGSLLIGDFCSISAGVHIYTHDTVLWALSGGRSASRRDAVSIANNCHIGAQAIILRGVSVGECSVIASNSLVNKSVAPRTIVGGSPARRLGTVLLPEGDEPRLVFD